MAPRLLICIGAAKSGTTWLYTYLNRHPDCHLRAVKELHYFDGVDFGNMGWQIKDNDRRQARLIGKLATAAPERQASLNRQIRDRSDWAKVQADPSDAAYLDYLSHGLKNRKVIADITPAYALLSADRFAQMARLTEDVRFLYLVRDPLARLWSHVRMNATRKSGETPDPAFATRLLRRVIVGDEPNIANRSDYAGTLDRLAGAVPADKSLILPFETMIAGHVGAITDFLGIAPRPANTDRVVHQGTRLDLPGNLRRPALDWLAPHYEAAIAHFGHLPPGWAEDWAG